MRRMLNDKKDVQGDCTHSVRASLPISVHANPICTWFSLSLQTIKTKKDLSTCGAVLQMCDGSMKLWSEGRDIL